MRQIESPPPPPVSVALGKEVLNVTEGVNAPGSPGRQRSGVHTIPFGQQVPSLHGTSSVVQGISHTGLPFSLNEQVVPVGPAS